MPPPDRRRILVVSNPAAGPWRRRRLAAVLEALHPLATVTLAETRAAGHATEIAREADPAKFDVIAAAGGDGTVNEIINGLVGKSIAVGVIPLGTANVLSIEIGLGTNPARVARALADGPIRPVRVGRVNGRRFIMMAGPGYDADVVASVSSNLKRRLGPLAYVVKAFGRAFDRTAPALDIEIDGTKYRAASVVVSNGRFYGGPFVAAPKAGLDREEFQIVLMKTPGPMAVAKYGLALVAGQLPGLRDVEVIAGKRVVIKGRDGQAVQADGDIVAHLPAEITVDPEPVSLVWPG
ncbi:MAG: diacylglycerol kinase family lipid kinase [Alphaproteobacteria bacterium]|nr:diacylglycerol kinase family lipid kinase [Alphaproteobacteria bacterium]